MITLPNHSHEPGTQMNFEFLERILSQVTVGDVVLSGAPATAPVAKIALTDSQGNFLGYVGVSAS